MKFYSFKKGSVKYMAVSYKRLWKLLIDKDLKKKDLAELANLSTYTINKLNRGDNVNSDTLSLFVGIKFIVVRLATED